MKTVGAYEAKTHLPRLLRRVAKGEEFTITHHGVPVARLVPLPVGRTLDPAEAVRQMRRFKKVSLRGLTIRELIEEGRR